MGSLILLPVRQQVPREERLLAMSSLGDCKQTRKSCPNPPNVVQRLWKIARPKGTRTEGFVGGTIRLVKSTLLSTAILTLAETPELRGTTPAGEMGKNLRTSLSLLNNLSSYSCYHVAQPVLRPALLAFMTCVPHYFAGL